MNNKSAGRKKNDQGVAPSAEKAGSEGFNFEKAIERLEKIVTEMEAGTLGLEEMIIRFEEGQRLIKLCAAKLNEVERKVEMLVKKGDEIMTEPFDEKAALPPEEPSPPEKEELF